MTLLEKLAELADELDKISAIKEADEVDELLNAIAPLALEEEKLMGVCDACGGSGAGIDSPWCEKCKGSGKGRMMPSATKAPLDIPPQEEFELEPGDIEIVEASLGKFSYIRHEDGKWNVYSKKGKRLGSYPSKAKAKKRLKQIELFKHMK